MAYTSKRQQRAREKAKRIRRRRVGAVIVIAVLVFLMAWALRSCQSADTTTYEAESDSSAVLVVGVHNNTPVVVVPDDVSSNIADIAIENGLDSIKVINATPTPKVDLVDLSDIADDISDMKKETDPDIKEKDKEGITKGVVEKINSKISELKPGENGADYLEAIKKSERWISGDHSIVYVFGSGLSDNGSLNFADNNELFEMDPNSISNMLIEKKEISADEMKGATVVWYGAGEVTYPPQVYLKEKMKHQVEDVYTNVLKAMGADIDSDSDSFKSIDSTDSYNFEKTVKPVSFLMAVDIWGEDDTVEITEDQITFIYGEAKFKDPEQAINVLTPFADYLKENRDSRISITGYESLSGEKKPKSELAQERADAVRDKLVEMGVKEDQVDTDNKGTGDSTRDNPKDRKVVIKKTEGTD
jgi:outer membrane protein OmpA-like peptidoglycan-associated protein